MLARRKTDMIVFSSIKLFKDLFSASIKKFKKEQKKLLIKSRKSVRRSNKAVHARRASVLPKEIGKATKPIQFGRTGHHFGLGYRGAVGSKSSNSRVPITISTTNPLALRFVSAYNKLNDETKDYISTTVDDVNAIILASETSNDVTDVAADVVLSAINRSDKILNAQEIKVLSDTVIAAENFQKEIQESPLSVWESLVALQNDPAVSVDQVKESFRNSVLTEHQQFSVPAFLATRRFLDGSMKVSMATMKVIDKLLVSQAWIMRFLKSGISIGLNMITCGVYGLLNYIIETYPFVKQFVLFKRDDISPYLLSPRQQIGKFLGSFIVNKELSYFLMRHFFAEQVVPSQPEQVHSGEGLEIDYVSETYENHLCNIFLYQSQLELYHNALDFRHLFVDTGRQQLFSQERLVANIRRLISKSHSDSRRMVELIMRPRGSRNYDALFNLCFYLNYPVINSCTTNIFFLHWLETGQINFDTSPDMTYRIPTSGTRELQTTTSRNCVIS
jgi:hypothetical protein